MALVQSDLAEQLADEIVALRAIERRFLAGRTTVGQLVAGPQVVVGQTVVRWSAVTD